MDEHTEAGKQGTQSEAAKVEVYRMTGPRWRSLLHPGSKTIGVPDMYLHKANVLEDDISEAAVKNGFSVPQVVGNETFSAHDMIFDRLKGKELLSQMGSLFHEVILRRDDLTNLRNSAGPLQSRPPQRVTLNEVKLAAYIKELADPNVPLKKLARSVPHGYRGERMLDMLWNGGNLTPAMAAIKAQSSLGAGSSTPSRSVTIERAIWFVRVVGSSELTSSRARQNNGTSYTLEWTNVVVTWLRKQIVELNIMQSSVATPTTPSSPAATSNRTAAFNSTKTSFTSSSHQDGHYSLLLEEDFRTRWVAKWQYSVTLLRKLCHEHLVEPQIVVKAVLDMLRTANIAQISFVLALFEEFLEVIYSNAALLDHALDTLCVKVNDLASTSEEGRFSASIRKEVQTVIEHITTRMPESLVNPSRWIKHRVFLTSLLQRKHSKEVSLSIKLRNEKLLNALLDREGLEIPASEADEQRTDIAILDRIAIHLSIQDAFLELFRPSKRGSSEKLRSILLWSTTTWRSGNHRPFAGAQLLHLFSQSRTSKSGQNSKMAISLQKIDLGTFLLKWISEVEKAMQQSNEGVRMSAIQSVDVSSLIVLVGEAIRLGAFSYVKYLQRLTARGLTAAQSRSDKTITIAFLHAKVMRSVPLSSASASLEHQRRIAIYGNRSKESWEEAMQRRAWKEAANAFPWLQLESSSTSSESSQVMEWNSVEPMRHFWSSSRFVQNRVIQGHFMAYFRQTDKKRTLSARCFAHLSQLLAKAEDFVSLCEIILILYNHQERHSQSLNKICEDVTVEHRIMWASMSVPLLEQLGLSSSFSTKSERRTSQTSQINLDVKKQLQESARYYLNENHLQSSRLLEEVVQMNRESTQSLACSLLFASASALHDVGLESEKVYTLINWMKLVPATAGIDWDKQWKDALVDSLSSFETDADTDVHAMARQASTLVLFLAQIDLFNATDLLRQFVVPCAERAITTATGAAAVSLQVALDLIRGLLLCEIDIDGEDAEVLARLRSIRSVLIVPETMKDITILLQSLALLEREASATDLARIRQDLCREPLIQIHFQPVIFELCTCLEEKVNGDQLSNMLVDLFPTRQTLLLSNALELDYQEIIGESDDWLCQQRLFELNVLVHRLETVESGLQNRAQSKIQIIAGLCAQQWFTPGTIQRYGLALMRESRSSTFAASVIEEMLKRIKDLLDEQGETRRIEIQKAIQCGLDLVDTIAKPILPSSTVVTSLLLSISEWLTTTMNTWGEAPEEALDKEEQLGLRLSVICLVLRFDNLWTTQTKTAAPELIYGLLRQSIGFSCQSQARDVIVDQILDVAAYCSQELTNDIRQIVQNSADSIITLIQQAMPEDYVANRILFLINRFPSTHTQMIIAHSGQSAFVSDHFIPVTERPWELHNNVEALDYYLQGGINRGQENHQDESVATDSTFLPLLNNGPISLELFAAKRTRDRLPPADAKLGSELSYGLGWGGEPLYARDVRRGLLDLETDDEIKQKGNILARMRGAEVIVQESPATKVPSKASSTPSKKRSEPASDAPTTTASTVKRARKR